MKIWTIIRRNRFNVILATDPHGRQDTLSVVRTTVVHSCAHCDAKIPKKGRAWRPSSSGQYNHTRVCLDCWPE